MSETVRNYNSILLALRLRYGLCRYPRQIPCGCLDFVSPKQQAFTLHRILRLKTLVDTSGR